MKLNPAFHLKNFLVNNYNSDAEAFKSIYQDHNSNVRAVIYQIAGEANLADLVQEAFVKIWRGLPKFNNKSELSTWIYRIASNVAIDSLRSKAQRKEDFEFDFNQLPDDSPGPQSKLESSELVQRGLATLTPDHRVVLVLAFIHERQLTEIAEILEVSVGTVKSRLHYAKGAFAKFLETKGVRS